VPAASSEAVQGVAGRAGREFPDAEQPSDGIECGGDEPTAHAPHRRSARDTDRRTDLGC